MKLLRSLALPIALFHAARATMAAVILSVDVNDATDSPADTPAGFSTYALTNNTLTIGQYTVDINPSSGAALSDVHRTTPSTTATLTLGAVYRDSVAAAGSNSTNYYRVGLDAVIGGLTPLKRYTLTAWSYDSGSIGSRVSDWSIVGYGGPQWVANNYTFDGATVPQTDATHRLTVTAYAGADGTLTLRGRPAAQSTTSSVYLNGLTVEESPDPAVTATTVLAVDFNDRANAGGTSTHPGFAEFLIDGTDVPGAIAGATTRTFASQTVTLTPIGGTMDDRRRTTPTNSDPFTDSQLLRDFVFASPGASGLDVRVQGLTPGATYLVEVWSFDSGSVSTVRTSDWTVNGGILWDDYGFNGANLPSTNDDGKMAGSFTASAGGELLISGRGVVNEPNVFLNALRVSALGTPPMVDFGKPIISEFLADNSSGITDEDGDTSDWIEIWNTTASSIDLAGYRLTDDPLVPAKWSFPSVTLAPQERLRVWASGKNRIAAPAALHTNFALSKNAGAYLAMSAPDGRICTLFENLPGQRANVSYGLAGSTEPLTAGYFQTPTPLSANTDQVPGFVADTTFNIKRGFYTTPQTVHISCATAGATIRYTTDGSEPTETSAVVPASGIPIVTTTVLRAKAFSAPLAPSNTDTQTYLFRADVQNQSATPAGWPTSWGSDGEVAANNGGDGTVPADYEMDPNVVGSTQPGHSVTDAMNGLPALSIVMNPGDFHGVGTGIYTNPKSVGDAWERACSIEFLELDGSGFHTGCGIRVHGNSSRRPWRMQKHSFRLAFRSRYGDGKLNYKLFDGTTVKSFDKLILHAAFTDGWGLVSWDESRYRPHTALSFRDTFLKHSFADMGHARISGRYAHLFINGLYWGVYEIGERFDEEFCADHFGGLETDYDVIAPGEPDYVRAGTGTAWDSLFSVVNSADLTQPANYESVAAQVDLVNFADYYLLHVHGDSEDWPHHNSYAYRNRIAPDRKWRMVAWDQEISMDPRVLVDRLSVNAPSTTLDKTAGRLYQKLRASPEFRLLFADRAHKHLHNGGALSLAVEQARWQSFADKLDKAIVAESARWGDTADATPYGTAVAAGNETLKRETHWLQQVATVKNSHFPALHNTANSYATITELRAQGLYPNTEPPAFGKFGGNVPMGYALTISAPSGQIYYTTDGVDPRTAHTGAVNGTLYTGPVSLTQTGTVKARALNGGEWSALTEATFIVGVAASSANLAVSELNYSPSAGDVEFIELLNISAANIDLTGVHFTGITFTFPDGTQLAPGERIIVTRDQEAFVARYGDTPRLAGQYVGALDNNGEEITVIASDGSQIVQFTYNNKAPWPTAADGSGASLVLRSPSPSNNTSTYLNDPSNWRSSTSSGGNPGTSDSIAFTGSALADADRDGTPALLEYLLGGNDAVPNDLPAQLLTFETIAVTEVPQLYLTITVSVRPGADDATLSAEWSGELTNGWQSAVFLGESVSPGGVTRKWRAPIPYSGNQQFLRIRASQAQ